MSGFHWWGIALFILCLAGATICAYSLPVSLPSQALSFNSPFAQHRLVLATCYWIWLLPWRLHIPSFCASCSTIRSSSAPYSSSFDHCLSMGYPSITAQIASSWRTRASNPRTTPCCHRYPRWTSETNFAHHSGRCFTGRLLFPHRSFSGGQGSPWVCSVLDAHCTDAPATVVSMPATVSPRCQ